MLKAVIHALAAGVWVGSAIVFRHPALVVAFISFAVIHAGISIRAAGLWDDEE